MTEESDAIIERLEKASQDQNQRREKPIYPPGFTLLYAQTQPIPQMGSFQHGYMPPIQMNKVGQNLEANMANSIIVPDLNDPKE